uniref:Uncharacterized protein n=1 Tax=Arundo donax TaxID=35708 RepID=A0A0A9GQ74_ARUDO
MECGAGLADGGTKKRVWEGGGGLFGGRRTKRGCAAAALEEKSVLLFFSIWCQGSKWPFQIWIAFFLSLSLPLLLSPLALRVKLMAN